MEGLCCCSTKGVRRLEIDKSHLEELANYKMPYGKYKGRFLVDIPEYYYTWFRQKGFPEGKLGRLMEEMHSIKINGLESLLRPLIKD